MRQIVYSVFFLIFLKKITSKFEITLENNTIEAFMVSNETLRILI